MSFGLNMAHAKTAIGYVDSLKIKSTNKLNELDGDTLRKTLCTRSINIFTGLYGKPTLETIKTLSERAIEWGVGNCFEKACVAFYYLLSCRLNARPLDLVSLKKFPGDHAFLLIGRPSESDISDFSSWGSDCVVCDPWDNKAYSASVIPDKFINYSKEQFVLRLEFRVE